jgi:alpha-glucosidase
MHGVDRAWWRDGVLYHIYLRSFADSDGDGVGDLRGVESRLDYLEWLGVDGIWISPWMPSPNADWGYDVSDYCAVDPAYGTMEDLERLVAEAASRGMRVIGDLVPNHSSTRHPWFVSSRSSRDDPKRDWYVWADPKPDGSPPNNWISNFFGAAWSFDEGTGQSYLHSFLDTQADLNWASPSVREEFERILRFWFERGIAGFRIDVVHKLAKDPARDNPPATKASSWLEQAWGQEERFNANQPGTHEILRGWRRVADAFDLAAVLIGETYVLDLPTMASYHGAGDELDLTFNIPFLYSPFQAEAMRSVIAETEVALGPDSWPVWNGGSHDVSRMATRWCGGDERKIRCALMMLLTLRGTPLLYYGDEIGMGDGAIDPAKALDPLGRQLGGNSPGRDPCRTPMQWSAGPGAGFTVPGAKPWLPIGEAVTFNVAEQRDDPSSTLNLVRDLIAFRRSSEDLRRGDQVPLRAPQDVLAWRRGEDTVIALNMSEVEQPLESISGSIAISSDRARDGEQVSGSLMLKPWTGVVVTT